MKVSVALAAVAGLATLAASAAAEEVDVYRWVDQDGIQHFTDRPPSNAGAELTGIRSQRTDRAALQARVEQQSETYTEDTEAARRRGRGT